MTHPLYVAIIWHMHQPFYRDLRAGEISLPWLRLHAAKDYLHMADVLADHPDAHATINMVPSLVEQMLAWADGRELDQLARLAEADSWTDAERRVILNLGFSISWDKVIRRHRRYAELLDRRQQALADPRAFSDADYRDLLGWFNMVWIDPDWLARDRELSALWARGRGFSTADLRLIHAKQRQIAAAVLPTYRRLAERGQLEITTSPYYHPILPLLADTESARRPSPGLPLPDGRLIAPEDAAAQLRLAVEAHTAWFGAPPQGLWPSEGAVSPEILPLVTAAGFTWLATDEAILGRSLGRSFERDGRNLVINPHALYRPYRVLADSELGPYVVFRDHELSDRIGFLYQNFPPEQAAEDFIYRLLEIRSRLNDPGTPYLVSVILDGENAWEHYERNGTPFLHALYAGLSRRAELKAVTVGEYLREFGPRPAATLARLATGSWISGDLTTWIGDPEHNRAWDALDCDARSRGADPARAAAARRATARLAGALRRRGQRLVLVVLAPQQLGSEPHLRPALPRRSGRGLRGVGSAGSRMARCPDQRSAPGAIRPAGDALRRSDAGGHAVCRRAVGRRGNRPPGGGILGRHAARRWGDRAPAGGPRPADPLAAPGAARPPG